MIEIPKAVYDAAKGCGTRIEYIGIYEGRKVFEVYTPTKEGVAIANGMPALVFYDGESAKMEIDGRNLDILDALNVS